MVVRWTVDWAGSQVMRGTLGVPVVDLMADGEVFPIASSHDWDTTGRPTVVAYIDETGHEEFADPTHPVFGFGGCASFNDCIEQDIQVPWLAMKDAYFGGRAVPLHAAELRSPSSTQIDAIDQFFRKHDFFRFANVARASLVNDSPITTFHGLLAGTLRLLGQMTRSRPESQVLLLIEDSIRTRRQLVRFVEGDQGASINAGRESVVPIRVASYTKAAVDAASEVADFVAHTAGLKLKKADGMQWPDRKDYDSVFRSRRQDMALFQETRWIGGRFKSKDA